MSLHVVVKDKLIAHDGNYKNDVKCSAKFNRIQYELVSLVRCLTTTPMYWIQVQGCGYGWNWEPGSIRINGFFGEN